MNIETNCWTPKALKLGEIMQTDSFSGGYNRAFGYSKGFNLISVNIHIIYFFLTVKAVT